MSRLKRVRECGRVPVGEGVGVRMGADGVAGYAGLAHCGSVWACPVCNAQIMAERALEISLAVERAQQLGYAVGMVTLTMRHHQGQGLGELWDALGFAWGRAVGGKVWSRERQECGLVGYLRAVEVTHGENGWHVHVHALVFLRRGDQLDRIAAGLWKRWAAGLRAKGLADPLLVGQDWKLLEGAADAALGRYLTKAVATGDERIGLELTSSQTKHARPDFGTVTPWAILGEFVATGETQFLALWREYEKASRGRRQVAWSNGLRDLLEIEPARADEEIVNEEKGSDEDTVCVLTNQAWARVVARDLTTVLLDVVEVHGRDALRRWCWEQGLELIDHQELVNSS